MKRKRLLASILVIAVLVSALVVPAAEDTTIPGVGDLADYTAAFSVEADEARAVDEEGNVYVTFHIYAKSSSADQPLRAFSFVLAPSDGLELANTVKNKDSRWYYELPNLASLKKHEDEGMYTEFSYTPSSRYFGAGGTDAGKGITDVKTELLTIVGKVAAGDPHGTYTLTLVTEGNDIVIAGNGVTLAATKESHQFKRVVTPSVVTVQSSNTISGTVTDDKGQPLADATVTLQDADGKALGEPVTTGGEGTFSFANVPNGTAYSIVVTAQDGARNGRKSVNVAGQDVNAGSINALAYQLGDVNKSGSVDILDVERLFEHVQGTKPLADADLYLADINDSGSVDILDVERLFEHVQGTKPLG